MKYAHHASAYINSTERMRAEARKMFWLGVLAGIAVTVLFAAGTYHTTTICPSQDPQTECLK